MKQGLTDLVIFLISIASKGSERADKTGATDDRLKEAMSINKYVYHK